MHLDLPNAVPDPRIRRFVPPTRIVWQQAAEGCERLLEGGTVTLRHGGQMPSVLLDFGREIHGGIRISNGQTRAHAPVRVRVRFGESVSEAMGEPNQDHAIHDDEHLIPWYGHAEMGNTGFRFVRIDLIEPGAGLLLEYVHAVFLYRDIAYQGSFECGDERLNTIWQTGAYTVHLCMQDLLWDGIKRDRLVWIGDMHPETMVINTVFGAHDIVPASLDYVRDKTPLPRWMNGISSYSLWWILIHHCWFLYHGDREYLARQREYLLGLLDQLRNAAGENGRENLGGHRFLDWPSSGDESAIHAGLQALLTMSLRAGGELCGILGEETAQERCSAAVEKLRTYMPPATSSKQANALLALAGYTDPMQANRNVLGADPLRGISTFYGYYVLQARALAGGHAGCIDVIRTYWGKMLDLGATTFWEDFNLEWTDGAAGITELVPEGMKDIHADFGDYCYKGLRHSLCHGWAAGPTAWLSEHVLGFQPLEPGCGRLRVAPNLAGLAYARGTFPTPHGPVTVEHRQKGTEVKSEIDAPAGVEIVR